MVRMYRAGTAFVDVIPSFRNIQKDIAKKLRNDLKEAFADKDAYSELDKNIERSFASAMGKASDEVRDHLREVNREIQRETEKGATASAKAVKQAVDKELGGGWYGEHTRKIGDQLKKHLGPDFLKGIKSEYQDTRKSIIRDVDSLTNAFTANGINDAREVERVYTRLKRALDKVGKLENVNVGKGKLASARTGAELLAKNFDTVVGGMTEQEVREQNRLHLEREKEERRHARQLLADQAAADREAIRLAAARQKARDLADAREEARQRRRYDDLTTTQSRDYTEIGSADKKGNARQQRITERRAQIIEGYQKKVNALMRDLESLGAVRPKVFLDTAEAVGKMEKVQSHLRVFMSEDYDKDLDINVDPGRVMNEMRILREGAKKALADIDLEVDIDDRETRATLARLRAELAEVSEWDVDARVGVDLDQTDYYEAKARIDAIGQSVKDIKLQIDDRDARSDITAIRLAVDAIKGKTVGVDITEREAVAQIETIKAALAAVRDKDVEIDVRYDDDALKRFARDAAIADAQSKRLARSIANAGTSMSESTQAFRLFNPMLAAVAFLGAPAVSAIGGLTAGVGALVSILPGAAAGLGTLGFAFSGLEDAVKKYDKAQEALAVPKKDLTEAQKDAIAKWEAEKDALGDATVAWIEYTRELKTGITEIQKGAREGLFPGLMEAIDMIMGRYAGPFTEFLNRTGRQLGLISEIWAADLTSSGAAGWFERVGEDAQYYLPRILQWTENTVTGFANLTDAFRPFAREFMNWLVDSSARFENWAGGLADNPKFERFLDSIRSTMPLLGDFAKEVGELFVNLTIAVEPFSIAIFDAMTGALEFLNAMDPTVLGAILGAVGGLTGGLMLLSGVVAGVGALATVMGAALSTPFTAAITGVATFSAVSATALGLTTAMSGAGGTLGEVMGTLGGALQGAADHGKAFWDAVLNLFDALSPLMPVLADVLADIIGLAVAVSDTVLVGGLNILADVVGWLADVFSSLPGGLQEVITIFGLLGGAGILLSGKMAKVSGGIGLVTEGFTGLIKGGKKWIDDSVLFMANIGETTAQFTGLSGAMKKADGNVSLVKTSLLGLGATTAVLAAVAGGIWLLTEAQAKSAELAEKGKKSLESYAEGAVTYGSSVRQGLEEVFDAEWWEGTAGTMEEQLGRLANMQKTGEFAGTKVLKQNLKELDEVLTGMVDSGNIDQAIVSWAEFAKQAEASGVDVAAMTEEHFPGFIESLGRINGELGDVVTEQQLMASIARGELPEALIRAMEESGNYEGVLKAIKNETKGAKDETEGLVKATDDLANRFMNQEEATAQFNSSMREIEQAIKDGKLGMEENTEAGDENRAMLRQAAKDARAKADADAAAGESAKKVGKDLRSAYKRIMENADALGLSAEEAEDYARELFGIPDDVDTDVYLNDYASGKVDNIIDKLSKIKDKEVWVKINEQYIRKYKDTGDGSDYKYKSGRHGSTYEYYGGIVDFYAAGGLRPMDPIAQMVPANTWRVVGDRMDVSEAYVPLDGSPRSWEILLEALRLMPGVLPFFDGGIAKFAAGAVASAGGATPAPAAPGQEDPNAATDMSAVSAAFEALSATLSASWGTLLADLLGQATTFYANLLTLTVTNHGLLIAADQSFAAQMVATEQGQYTQLSALQASHNSSALAQENAHHSALASIYSSFRSTQTSATSSFFSTLYSTTANGGSNIRSSWSDTLSAMATRASGFRGDQADYFDHFLNGTLLGTFSRFGNSVNNGWADTWRDLVSSAKTIFSVLPREVGSILSDTSGKMNKHIVDPYNKIVKDLDLKKSLKIPSFPVQKYADGGIMRGYTPGRDVHTFVSNTGGVLELSGGEPVLRPELGAVLGSEWVDQANAAARNGGINGAKKFLLGHQAYADGGIFDGGHQALASGGRIKKDRAGLIQLGKVLQGLGVKVTEHPAFGGVAPGAHSSKGWHYRAGAIDLNTAPGQSAKEIADFDRIIPLLYKLGWGVIWRYPNHLNHAHVDIGNTALGTFNRNPNLSGDLWEQLLKLKVGPPTGGGSADFFDLKSEMSGWIGNAKKAIGSGAIPELMMGAGDKVFSALADAKSSDFIEASMVSAGAAGNYQAGGGVKRWASVVREALKMLNLPVTDSYVNMTLRRMNQESGGNPRAINNWDSNARRGTPSKGLMQVIPPTFRAYAMPGYSSDIYDPLSNILASMRYALKTYGSLPAAYNKRGGYADGGMIDLNPDVLFRDGGGPVPKGYSMVLNDLNHEETILPKTTHEVTKAFERIEDGEVGGPSYNIYDNVFGDTAENAITEMHRQSRIAKIGAPVKL